jgi:hypothetical protein
MKPRRRTERKRGRRGKPLTVYFSNDHANRLASLCGERRVAKSEIIRFALDKLLKDLDEKQLELPFGLR